MYLDVTETQISKQISTKANTFFNAIHSQDEVQEHVLKTCIAIKQLRKKLEYLDNNVIMSSIKLIKLTISKFKLKLLLEKVNIVVFIKFFVLIEFIFIIDFSLN